MKSKSLFILFFSLVSSFYIPSFGQRQHFIDSLEKKLDNATEHEKVQILFNLSWSYKFSNPQRAYEQGKEAYLISKSLNNKELEAISLNRMGAAKLKSGDLSEALTFLLKAVEICENNNYFKVLVTSMRHIGDVYEAQGNNSEAMKYYYNSLGLSDTLDIPLIKARSAKKVAYLYLQLKKYNSAKGYLDYCLQVFEEDNYLRGLHQTYILYGDYYLNQDLLDSALLNYELALEYLNILKDRQGYATVKARIAKVYEKEGSFSKAISGYNSALDTFKANGNKKQLVSVYIDLANVYSKSKKYGKGIYYGKKALEEAKRLNFSNEEKKAYQALFMLNKENKNLKLALQYLESYIYLMDSLANSTESWRIDQMQKSYALEIKMKEHALNTAIISNQTLTIKNERLLTRFLLVTILIVCLLAILIWYSLKHSRKVNAQLLLANEEKNEAISLISHDLKSPFNKIKGLTHILELQNESGDEAVKEILSKINTVSYEGLTLVQNLVDIKALKSGAYTIKLSKFDFNDFIIKRVQSFEQLAQTKNIIMSFESSKNECYVVSDINSIARIFDNILSNAIKFSASGDTISIDCSLVKNSFSFSISDNGKGISQEEINQIFNQYKTGNALPTGSETSSGLGLAIVSSLVNKLNGTIKCISEINAGATFIVSLPLNKEAPA